MSKTDVIYRVLSGMASDEEREDLRRWIARSGANREEYQDLEVLYRLSPSVSDGVAGNRHHERFEQIRQVATMRLGQRARTRRVSRLIISVACTMLAIFVGSRAFTDFKPRTLHFQDQTLRQVLAAVERTYGIEVRLEDNALASCRFTGTFHRIDQPDEVVRSISRAIKANFVTTSPGKYRILAGGC